MRRRRSSEKAKAAFRAGWLAVLFVGEMFTATAMSYFEGEIAHAVVLALFVPLIISSGGNSGSQAASLVIRSLALRELKLRDWHRVFGREVISGVMLGALLGGIGFARGRRDGTLHLLQRRTADPAENTSPASSFGSRRKTNASSSAGRAITRSATSEGCSSSSVSRSPCQSFSVILRRNASSTGIGAGSFLAMKDCTRCIALQSDTQKLR
jgi:hypothetical protein